MPLGHFKNSTLLLFLLDATGKVDLEARLKDLQNRKGVVGTSEA